MKNKRIGVLGGSFSPVHNGHLFLAKYVRENCSLDKVIMIPTGKHPFHKDTGSAQVHHRMNMLRLALETEEGIEVSDMEINSDAVSYTYVTLRRLQEEYGADCKLFFIVGTDEIMSLECWYEAEKLLKEFSFIVGVRPHYEMALVAQKIQIFHEKWDADIQVINLPAPDVSSSEIREAISRFGDLQGLVPDRVNEYIKENRLYMKEGE